MTPLGRLGRKTSTQTNITELKDAITVSKDTATGPDDIHCQMLKHLPEFALDTLLHIFNGIWTTGGFSERWRLTTIIPIPKPGKDHADPTNYRPTERTSCPAYLIWVIHISSQSFFKS